MRSALYSLALVALFALANAPQATEGSSQSSDWQGQDVDWADCLACHKVAGSELPKLADLRPAGLGLDLPVRCDACHTDLKLLKPVSDWRHPAQPLALHLACTDCHLATAHDKAHPPPRPTGDYNAAGCYKCHASVRAQRRMTSSHGERLSLRCRDCHPPHTPLLVAIPAQFVPQLARNGWNSAYDWQKSNSGCLDCHPPGQLLYGLTQGFVTLNTENYHARHVQGGHVLCIECHAEHGSVMPKLMRNRLLTGEVLSFMQHAGGGSCNLQCHNIRHDNWAYINSTY